MGLNFRAVTKITILVVIFIGVLTIVPAVVSFIYGETNTAVVFLLCASVYITIGSIIFLLTKIKEKSIRIRDALLTVCIVWIITIVLGAVPLSITADISFIDALFESASGFTTSGGTVIPDVESLPKGVLFFRAFSHWIGGLGIVILVIAVIPMFGSSGRVVAKAEASKSMTDKILARYSDTAKKLFSYYLILTVLCIILLWIGKMNLFDSITHALGTVSTGGFSNYNEGLTTTGGFYEYWVLIIFMLFGSINFTLYYYLFSTHWREFFKDTELRWYTSIVAAGALLITFDLFFTGSIKSFGEALTHSTFNLVSVISTTGFASINYDLWPSFAKMILLMVMLIGGCSASTSGGVKTFRIVIVLKLIKRNITRRLHPSALIAIKSDEGPMRSDLVSAVAAYIFLYMGVVFISSMLLSIENQGFMTTISAVVACTGNIGPGFDAVGPLGNFGDFSIWGKSILIFDMIAGRLELFGVIILFTKRFWNPDRVRM